MATKTATKGASANDLKSYVWTGKDKRGKVIKGEQLSKSEALVKAELRKRGIVPSKVGPKPKPLFGAAGKKIKPKDIAFFSRQMATMMQAGVPLITGLNIIAGGVKNPRFKKLLDEIKDSIEGGSSLYESLSKHPYYFDELYVNLVQAGESAGVLDTILDTIASYKENIESIKGKIKKALFYPAAVIVVAILVSAIMLMYVIPMFEDLFTGFGADLPAFTRMLVNASDFLRAWWWLALIAVVGAVVGFIQGIKRSKKFAHFVDRMILKIPVIGQIMKDSAVARFARTLSITFKAGVPLVEALDSVAGATGNIVYGNAVKKVKEDVAVGYPLNQSMAQTNVFPHLVMQMTAIGEESGALDTMLLKVAEYYEEQVNNAVDALSSLIEPMIMVFIGVVVGSMVVGMYLPIFKLGAAI